MANVIQQVVENLRGEALQVAIEIGIDVLIVQDGSGGEKLMEEMKKHKDYVLTRSRWVLSNKGDAASPDVRARLVACEINHGDRNDIFAASTPPLEAKRL